MVNRRHTSRSLSKSNVPVCPLVEAELLRRSFLRLSNQWKQIHNLSKVERREVDLARWHHAAEHERQLYAQRLASTHQIVYPQDLPITNYREHVVDLLRNRQVIIVCGETGSGKSTQLPKLCMEAGLGTRGWIGHTQPRRLAARTVANRLAQEFDSKLGDVVGYTIRFQDHTPKTSRIKLMTDGILLSEIKRDRFLDAYDCVILDEVHERSLNIDLLMAYLHRLLPVRPDLRLVITSATMNALQFSEHFQDAIGPAPIVIVEGRSFPVEIRYRGAIHRRESFDDAQQVTDVDEGTELLRRFCDAIDELHSEGHGDILAFFPTERDIRDATKYLRGHLTRKKVLQRTEVLPLYARLTEAEQQRVFQPHSMQRVVLATNVAESSITVPGIRYVIDTGTARISRFAAKSRVQRLPIEPISQASANQRSGRCGRLGPGIAIRLYDEIDFQSRPMFAVPEVRRSNLAATILHIKSLGIDDIESLPWLDPPRSDSVREGLNVLFELSALDSNEELTDLGRKLSQWPTEPRVGRILIEADRNGCLHDALIVASAMESQDPRVRPPDHATAADEAHAKFRDPSGDFVSFLKIWDFFHELKDQLGRSRLEKACKSSYLSLNRLREWADVYRQLREQCIAMKLHIGPRKTPSQQNFDLLHRSVLAGLLSNIAMLEDVGKYRAASGMEISLWPGSSLKNTRPKWIVAGEFIETSQRYARIVAKIDVAWIEQLALHLIRYHYEEPHFSRKQGSAMVMRKGTLFGLPVAPRVAVPLAPIDPTLARQLLIEHGLAENQLVSRAAFWQHNQRFLEKLRAVSDRTRRRDWIIDPYALIQFYRARIPNHVVDRVTLEKWDRSLKSMVKNAQPDSTSPYLSEAALSIVLNQEELDRDFPEELSVEESKFPLRYRFEPGDPADGISMAIPPNALPQMQNEKLEWLVPGLLPEKIAQLIKTLPKRIRTQCIPIPNTVQKILPQMIALQKQNAPFWKSLCEILSKHAGTPVTSKDFDVRQLPEHLRLRVALVDEQGKELESSRNLADLQHHSVSQKSEQTSVLSSVEAYPWARQKMTTWDIDSLPSTITVAQGGIRLVRYPTIVVSNNTISTALMDDRLAAEQSLRSSLIALFARIEKREISSQIQFLPDWPNVKLRLSNMLSEVQLSDRICELIAKLAFVDTNWQSEQAESVMRTRLDFDLVRMKRVERIAGAAAEIGRWLPKLAEANHKLRLARESLRLPAVGLAESVAEQLNTLWGEPWSIHTPWCYVREFPRYLNAITMRLERFRSIGQTKDKSIQDSVDSYWKDYLRRRQEWERGSIPPGSRYPVGRLLEYRWLIEEYRVSLFAQQLGTRVSVSAKRLEKLRDSLDSEP